MAWRTISKNRDLARSRLLGTPHFFIKEGVVVLVVVVVVVEKVSDSDLSGRSVTGQLARICRH